MKIMREYYANGVRTSMTHFDGCSLANVTSWGGDAGRDLPRALVPPPRLRCMPPDFLHPLQGLSAKRRRAESCPEWGRKSLRIPAGGGGGGTEDGEALAGAVCGASTERVPHRSTIIQGLSVRSRERNEITTMYRARCTCWRVHPNAWGCRWGYRRVWRVANVF